MSHSRKKSNVINLCYKVVNQLSKGTGVIERDKLWHRYEVNKHNIKVYGLDKTQYYALCDILRKKLNFSHIEQRYSTENENARVYSNDDYSLQMILRYKDINDKKMIEICVG